MEARWFLQAATCLKVCIMVATRIIGAGALEAPEFNYRGAISYGQSHFSAEGNFFLGPAVDECAGHYETAEGAFVMLTPQALAFRQDIQRALEITEQLHKQINKPMEPHIAEVVGIDELLPYAVPCKVKDGGVQDLNSYVVNPLANWERAAWADRSQVLLSFFGEGPSEAAKKKNTAEFFEVLQRQLG